MRGTTGKVLILSWGRTDVSYINVRKKVNPYMEVHGHVNNMKGSGGTEGMMERTDKRE